MMIRTVLLLNVGLTLLCSGVSFGQQQLTIFNDADATVRVICRNDYSEEDCLQPLGDPTSGEHQYIRVHDQNQLETGYWHFNLSQLAPNAQVTSARFQLDAQTNSWGDTALQVVAITDPSKDWDLNAIPEEAINGVNAPLSDWDSYAWTGDPDNQQRFNAPTPFLDEGESASSVARRLVPEPDYILINNQDPNTIDETNAYGGVAGEGGPGGDGSADGGDNIWPTQNAVDLDITDLVKWKLGQNAAYSTFNPTDRELTIMARTEVGLGTNGFVRFISNESGENTAIILAPDGEPALMPGRIVVSYTGGTLAGDFDTDGDLDSSDINALSAAVRAGNNPAQFDVNNDSAVNAADRTVWVNDLKKTYFGDANLDLEFNSSDFVAVFTVGKYETGGSAEWQEGDWNGDGLFNSGDFVAAFTEGGYEKGPRPAVAGVPEPSTILLFFLGVTTLVWRRRGR
jgi:hypothetical protein